jgi:hypothetical protein
MLSPVHVGPDLWIICLLRDVTRQHDEKVTREKLVHDLGVALKNVRTLSGLLPICAWCKRIRDDKGYWARVEEYFHDHSDVAFTHGICPDCARKLARREQRGIIESRGFPRETLKRRALLRLKEGPLVNLKY